MRTGYVLCGRPTSPYWRRNPCQPHRIYVYQGQDDAWWVTAQLWGLCISERRWTWQSAMRAADEIAVLQARDAHHEMEPCS